VVAQRGACGCGGEEEVERVLKEARKKDGRSNPIVRASQITLEHAPRMNMNDKPNVVAVFYQNAGHIYRSEKDFLRASRCLRVGARTLRKANKTQAAILYMECCNLLLPPAAAISQDTFVPPNAAEDFREALQFQLEVNQVPGGEPNKWLPEALGLLRRLCIILDHGDQTAELFGWFLVEMVILLTLPDTEAAKEALVFHEQHASFRGRTEHQLARNLISAFSRAEGESLQQVQIQTQTVLADIAARCPGIPVQLIDQLIGRLNIFRGFERGMVP